MVNRRSDTDLGNTQSAPRGGSFVPGLTAPGTRRADATTPLAHSTRTKSTDPDFQISHSDTQTSYVPLLRALTQTHTHSEARSASPSLKSNSEAIGLDGMDEKLWI